MTCLRSVVPGVNGQFVSKVEIRSRFHPDRMTVVWATVILLGLAGVRSAVGQDRDPLDQLESIHSDLDACSCLP